MTLHGSALLAGIVALGVLSSGAVDRHSAVVIGVAPSPAEIRAEAARVPAHAQTWYYFGLIGVNAKVPPEIMARYADFVEDNDYGEFAARFKAAGGRYAAAYTNPSFVPYCDPPFTPPAGRCKWEYGRFITAESGWFHGPDGARVHHYVPGDKAYQEAINFAAPVARRAWRDYTAMVKRRAPALDFLFADDSGAPLHSGDMSPTSGHFDGYNAAAVELQSDDAFRDAAIAYLGESALPLILNGGDPHTALAAYGGAILRAPFVRGNTHEGCFRYEGGVKTLEGDRWSNEQNTLLQNARFHRWGICFMTGTPTPANRLYALASWWLSYDPQWSVAAPIDVIPSQSALLPEYALVPRFPGRSAVDDVGALRTQTGAFAREFAACYQNRALLGRCAAIVNPTSRTVAMPHLEQSYRLSLSLGGGDVINGGTLTWSPVLPTALAPGTAAVLAR